MRAGLAALVVSGLLGRAALGAPEAPVRPSPAQAAVAEGVALLHQNRVAEARTQFERALALDPASADAHYMLGWLREQEKDLPGAEKEYEAALARAPARAEVHDRLGFVRGELGRTE